MANLFIFGLLVVIFTVATFVMRGKWEPEYYLVYAYGALVCVAMWIIFFLTRDYVYAADRHVLDLDEALPYLGAIAIGALFGRLADFIVSFCEHWKETEAERKFFAARRKDVFPFRVDFNF